MRPLAGLWFAAALAIVSPLTAQVRQAAPPAPFRSATALVEVDIIVKDRDGRFVGGLTADDFEVLEEGRPQKVQHFYLVTEHASAAGAPQSEVMVPRSPDQTARRTFVLYFDTDHLAAPGLARLKQAALTFVGSEFRPGDLGGVFANGALWHGHLTSDRQELLDGVRGVTPALDTAATRRARLVEYPRIDSELDAVRIEAGDQRMLDSVAAQNCMRERANCDMEGGAEYVVVKLQRKAQTYVAEARRAARATVTTLSYLSKNLAGLEGRKTLLMISEGFFTDNLQSELPLIAGQASRAGVTIYTLDGRGTSAAGGRTVADASVGLGSLSMDGDTAEDGLDLLARATGGLPLRHTDNFAAALTSIAEDTSTYYVLAYAPEVAALDGRYRAIQLRTSWKGLSVRARRGYVATPLPRPKPIRAGG